MIRENIMNGTMPNENDNLGVGVGIPGRYMEVFLNATTDKKVSVKHNFTNCILDWEPFDGADNYRVDLYRPDDRGPNCGDINYVCTESKFTTDTHYETDPLEVMETYYGIVFAYCGNDCIARYSSVFCIIAPVVVGDMLKDSEDDFVTGTSNINGGKLFKYMPLPAEKSSILLNNPDRGFRSEEDYFIPAVEDMPDWTPEDYYNDAARRIKENVYGEKVTVSRIYFILNNYINEPVLPEKVIEYMQGYYDAYRRLGVKMYLGHYYQHGGDGDNVADKIVIGHIKQLTPLFRKNADVIYLFSMNFIGAYGEWTCMRKRFDYQAFTNAVLEAVPDELYIMMRMPMYKQQFINKDYYKYYRIGFANEALHGYRYPNLDKGQGFIQPGSKWWDVITEEGVYSINDGELFTTRWTRIAGSWSTGISNMKVMSCQHLSSMSLQHAFGDICQFGGDIDQTNIYAWRGEEVTEELLENMGLHSTTGWFIDGKGDKIRRNAYEYVRDYLGYRISAKTAEITADENTVSVKLNLKNYGSAAAFNLKSGFVLLDGEKVVADIEAGAPETWYTTDPKCYENRELLTHTVTAAIPLEGIEYEYSIGFYMKNSLGQFARLDNSIEYKNGYNILCKATR